MQLEFRLNLHLLHLVGVRERERAKHVETLATNVYLAFGYGTVTLDGSHSIANVQ